MLCEGLIELAGSQRVGLTDCFGQGVHVFLFQPVEGIAVKRGRQNGGQYRTEANQEKGIGQQELGIQLFYGEQGKGYDESACLILLRIREEKASRMCFQEKP